MTMNEEAPREGISRRTAIALGVVITMTGVALAIFQLETFLMIYSTVGWIGSLTFLGVYHRSARWWQHAYGRALFALAFVAFMFFTTSMMFNLFGADYPGRTALRVTNMLLSVTMVWYLLITLVRGRIERRRLRRRETSSE